MREPIVKATDVPAVGESLEVGFGSLTDEDDRLLAAAADARHGRPARGGRAAGDRRRCGPQARRERWGTSCSTARRAWARPRSPRAFRASWACRFRSPAARRCGAEGPDAVSDQRRRRLGAVHRRDPSAAQGGRGVSVPGDGGFSHRHHAGRRGERPDDQHAAAAVHADRRHDAHGLDLGAAARSVSDCASIWIFTRSRSWPRSSAAAPRSCG